MSMSTGDVRRPFSAKVTKATAADDDGAEAKTEEPEAAPAKKAVGKALPPKAKTTPAAKKAPAKLLDRPAPPRKGTGGKGGGGGNRGRRPVTPVKVNQGPNWGPILMFGGAGLVALLIVGFAAFQVISQANQPGWQDRAAGIAGLNSGHQPGVVPVRSRGQPQGRRPHLPDEPAGRWRPQRPLAELHGRRLHRAGGQGARRAQP
jgi:hypothetical protein